MKVRVVATRGIADVGQFSLAPLTRSALRVANEAAQGWAPEVKVTVNGTGSFFYLTTSSSLPLIDKTYAAVAALALADGSDRAAVAATTPKLCEHLWKPSVHDPLPFWAMRRADKEEEATMKLRFVAVPVGAGEA